MGSHEYMLTSFFLMFWFQHILYRQKEQFSDGVGYSWIDGLKDHANEHVFLGDKCSLIIDTP